MKEDANEPPPLEPFPDPNKAEDKAEYARLKGYMETIPEDLKAAESDTEGHFLESLVHFGYITMFSPLFPLA